MLEITKFEGEKDGKHLLVLGSIHGQEPYGTKAIEAIIKKIKNKEIKIEAGTVTFIAPCNEEAYKQNKYFIDVNLNRVFKKGLKPTNYEEKIACKIMKYIDECDYLLDIHTTSVTDKGFSFLDVEEDKVKEFVEILNFENIIVGWPSIFNEDDKSTCGYGFKQGKICATIEAGTHTDPNSQINAEISILNALSFLKIANCPLKIDSKNYKYTKMIKMHMKTKPGDFVKKWNHLDEVKAGEVIAKYDDGEEIKAEEDFTIIMPGSGKDTKIGTEWIYLGKNI